MNTNRELLLCMIAIFNYLEFMTKIVFYISDII